VYKKIDYIYPAMKEYFYFIVFFSIGLICGCNDAPRDNPLDPQSLQYISTASVSGTVTILNQITPLSSAAVLSLEDGVSTTSNTSGVFSFDRLTSGVHTFICTKANYSPDTLHVDLQAHTSTLIHFSLNGAPYIVSQKIYTRTIDQNYPGPQYFVDVTASVADPNGINDIDSVWFFMIYSSGGSLASDTFSYPMTYDVSARLFKGTIYNNTLPTKKIQWLVGKPLQIKSRDFHNAINYSDPFYVTRIIENIANPLYPATNPTTSIKDTTDSTPLLHWSLPGVTTYNYTYSLTISRIISGWRYDIGAYTKIASGDNAWKFPGDTSGTTLDSGDYVWTITVLDDFGNYSRSKEAPFVVK
jgi:hypothetical protein